ncbi:hypothetical protein BH11MYX3_BH11MYX3_00070 [soil metagenome]
MTRRYGLAARGTLAAMRSLLLLALIGCRSYPVVSVPTPALPPEPALEVKSTTAQVRTGSKDVCDGESRCRSEDTQREEVRSRVLVTGQPLSYGQVRLLDEGPDGAYGKSLKEYGIRAKPCRKARTYKLAGAATTVVGGTVALIDGISTPLRIGALVVAAGGIALIYLGFQNGSGCDDVHKLYIDERLNIAEDTLIKDRATELAEIAARFNAQHAH